MKRLVRILPLLAAPFIGACEVTEFIGPPGSEDLESFVQTLDVQSFQSIIDASAAQVEVTLLPGGLTASELAVRPSGQSSEERIQSRAVGYATNGATGSLTLALGGLVVTFDEDTRFFFGQDEIDVLTFMSQISGNLDEGFDLPVVAERAVPAIAQDPDDGTFLAASIAIDTDGSPQLRLEIDEDNLELNANPQDGEPDGWLNVLGLEIQLRVTDGTTELEQEDHDFEVIEDFEGLVETVEIDEMLITLEGGTTVRVADRTELVQNDELLGSLQAAAEALATGAEVIAWGRGAVQSEDPLILVGIKLSMRAREVEEPEMAEFEGVVEDVSLDGGFFALTDGTVVRITDNTEVVAYNDGSPSSLAGIVEAMEEGLEVVSWGAGAVEDEEPLTLEATRVVLKSREPAVPGEEFEGEVVEADAESGSLQLENGWVIVVGDGTEVVAYNDQSPMSVAGVVEAMAEGLTVKAWGYGEVESEGPVVIAAGRIVLKAYESAPDNEVQGYVHSINVEGMTLTLENGKSIVVTEETEIVAYNDFSPVTLEGALEDLDRYRIVWAKATGAYDDQMQSFEATRLVLKTVVEDFEKDVVSIDGQGNITLEGGWILHVWDDAVLMAADDDSPMTLEGAREALAAGDRVRVWGYGFVVCLDPFSIEVAELTIRRIPQG